MGFLKIILIVAGIALCVQGCSASFADGWGGIVFGVILFLIGCGLDSGSSGNTNTGTSGTGTKRTGKGPSSPRIESVKKARVNGYDELRKEAFSSVCDASIKHVSGKTQIYIDSSYLCDDRFTIRGIELLDESERKIATTGYTQSISKERDWGMVVVTLTPR